MITFHEYATQPWLGNGLSAKALYGFATKNHRGKDRPHDPDDWCRVLQVLSLTCGNNVEKRKELLMRMGEHNHSAEWKALSHYYEELQCTFEKEWDTFDAPKTYELMKRVMEDDLPLWLL